MPIYRITAPNGKTYQIEGPPGASDADVAQAVMAQFPEAAKPTPETTVGGNVKEFFKGLAPGAINLAESAAAGASSILPDDAEKSVREAVGELASSAREPFAAAPGYEDSVGRKFGEAAGSAVPFFALGPLGVAGKVGAGLLGSAAGAGEARKRAEDDTATDGQRGTATALGAVVGVSEILPVFKFLENLSTPVKDGILSYVRRAAVTGGAEGAQEAAAQVAQNLIAQQVYKPEQSLLEGSGESAAYGAGVGALIQGITDLAFGRRTFGGSDAATDIPPIEQARAAAAAKKAAAQVESAPTTEAPALPALPAPPTLPALAYTPNTEQSVEEAPTATPPATEVAPPTVYTPPAPETVPEAAPGTVMTAELFKELGIKNPSAGVRKQLEGKDWSNPEERTAIINRLTKYLENPRVSTENADRVSAFLETLGPVETSTETQSTIDNIRKMIAENEKEQSDTTPTTTVGTGTDTTTASVSPTPDIPGVGVDSGPVSERPTIQPDPISVVVPEESAGTTDGRKGKQDATVETSWDKLHKANLKVQRARKAKDKADSTLAVDDPVRVKAVEAYVKAEQEQTKALQEAATATPAATDIFAPIAKSKKQSNATEVVTPKQDTSGVEYNQEIVDDLIEQKRAAAQKIKDYRKAQENLRTPGGALLPGKKEAYDQLQVRIDNLKYEIAETRKQLTAQNKAKKATEAPESAKVKPLIVQGIDKGLPDPQPTFKQAQKEVIEAVGAYNNPTSDATRRKLATDYLFDSAKDPSLTEASRNLAKRALRYAVDPADLTGPQQKEYDALTKDAKDDETAWGSYVYVERDTPGVEIPELTRAVEDGDAFAALKAIARKGSPLDRAVAMRLLRMKDLPNIEIVPEGTINGDGVYDVLTDTIKIVEGQVDTHTVLHEMVHAATYKIIVANAQGIRNDLGYRRLKELYDDFKAAGHADQYGLKDVAEFASEAMSNPEFQRLLQGSPYKNKQTIWEWFVNSIKNLLGMKSALAEAMMATESLIDVGRDYQRTGPDLADRPAVMAGTPAIEQLAAQIDILTEKKKPTFAESVRKATKPMNLRQKLSDIDAPIDDIFTKAYQGKVRDSQGNLNPMVLLSRARDFLRVSKAAQEDGTIARHPSGLFKATSLTIPMDSAEFPLLRGQTISYKDLISRIATEAKQSGKTYEAYAKELGTVLYGHREHELVVQRGLTGYTPLLNPQQIAQAEAAYQASPGLQEISQTLDAIRYSLIDAMVDAGRLTTEKAQQYKDATGYIPFNRIMEFDNAYEGQPRGANKGIAALKNIKQIHGSDQNVMNPIEAFSGMMDWFVGETMKNDAAIKALSDLEVLTLADRVPNPAAISGDMPGRVVSVFDQGVRAHFYLADPAHALTFDYQPATISGVLRGLQKGSQILRAGVTAAPPFALKQIADDIIRAYVYSGVKNPLKLTSRILTNFPKLFLSEVLGKNNPTVKALTQLGVIGTFDFTESTNLKNILEEAGAKKKGLGANILRVMEAGAKASDLAVRKAIYDQVLQETGDVAAAESRAREIINFSRRGSSKMMDYMIRIVPFFNAYARGMDKLAVAAAGGKVGLSTGQARSMFYKRMGVMTAMGLTYAIMMSDDEEYNALPDYVRDRNWVLPHGAELGFTPVIPIPAELAFFFKAIPERVVQYYKLQGTDEERLALSIAKDLMLQGVDVFSSPNVTPQLLKPLLENIANYSFFLGRPLESQSQVANLRPFQRYGTGTSELAKAAGEGLESLSTATGIEALALSPIKIENMIRGLFGTTAGTVLAMTDAIINPTRTDRPMHTMLSAQLTGASAFMKDGVGGRYIDEIYNLERRVEQTYSTYNRIVVTDPERAVEFLEKNIGLYSARPLVRTYLDRIKELNSLAIKIDKMTDVTPQEKRDLITELKIAQAGIARDVFRLGKNIRDIQSASTV